ncbi:HD-GYP domain-containing protein [Marinifilum sp. JC120]|nr:HD-GYP domain-containing protein [Marinifilum sp. JC120]
MRNAMLKKVSVKRLRVGLHIYLKDIPWFKHQFFRSNFKIKDRSQINEIQGLDCDYVYYDPQRSDCDPLKEDAKVKPVVFQKESSVVKKIKASELKRRKDAYLKTEKQFHSSAKKADKIMQGVLDGRIAFCDEAMQLAHEFANIFLDDVQITLNLINFSASDDEFLYYHPLNVSILSCMLGAELGISDDEMYSLAFGALMHDIGKSKIPKKIIHKRSEMTKAELKLFQMHPLYGVEILSGVRSVDKEVMKIIYHHHVYNVSGGYPSSIEFKSVNILPKIVAVADLYDNLINKRDCEKSLTPHEALASMYRDKPQKLDENILSHFIRMLGIYPPGSMCELNTGEVAMVTSTGDHPLLPNVIVYDPHIPKNKAMILKLGTDINSKVERIISCKDLTPDQLKYLSPKTKLGYYADSKQER